MIASRRGFLGLLASALAAPAIVKAESLMRVASVPLVGFDEPTLITLDDYSERVLAPQIQAMKEEIAQDVLGNSGLLTINQITKEAIRLFKNSNEFLKNLDNHYDSAFAVENAKIVTKLQIRLPNKTIG